MMSTQLEPPKSFVEVSEKSPVELPLYTTTADSKTKGRWLDWPDIIKFVGKLGVEFTTSTLKRQGPVSSTLRCYSTQPFPRPGEVRRRI